MKHQDQRILLLYHLGIYKVSGALCQEWGWEGSGAKANIYSFYDLTMSEMDTFFLVQGIGEKKQIINFQILLLRLDEFNKFLQNNN